MKVLIVKVSALGDVIHTLPVLAYLHSACSNIEIDWLVEEGFAAVLDGHPLLRQVIPLQTKRWRRLSPVSMLCEMWHFSRQLRQQRYDLVFDLQGNSKSGLFTFISRGKNKYGFDRHQVREWPNLLATRHHVTLNDNDHHVARRALAVVKAAIPGGTDFPSAGPLQVSPEAQKVVEQQLQQLDLLHRSPVVLHYGTTWQTKLWSLENWQQLAIRLVEQGDLLPLLTWGNDEELKAVTAIAEVAPGVIIWPRGSLSELVALLDRVSLVVGCDTGPIHIAAALGTPTVSIFRVTDATRNAPIGEIHRSLQTPMSCAGCLLKQCDKDAQCADSISVADVYRAITELMTAASLKG
ncbi:MAG: lipopolysaccharide heptosyltransferase I [Desulfuromusa sp.]|nr:lipopolysaccharide heptosyltransferase I [Desulfuromusa sp.]